MDDRLCVYTVFDNKTKTPIRASIRSGEKYTDIEFYCGCKTVKQAKRNVHAMRDFILRAESRGTKIILSDFKEHIKQFGLPKRYEKYNVFDVHLPSLPDIQNGEAKRVLDAMYNTKVREYQKLISNSAVVYQDLEDTGLYLNYTRVWPKWSQNTFSGRSKTTGFNVQNYHEQEIIKPASFDGQCIFIHFDWICADIRAASLMSDDDELHKAFEYSDPYAYMADKINEDAGSNITREESKLYLLKCINSMDYVSDALLHAFPGLGSWVLRCKKELSQTGYLMSVLGRKYQACRAKNELAILNGIMQGSVAHAMQNVIRTIWEKLPNQLIAEIFDSVVVCSLPDIQSINRTINTVINIMTHPFKDLLAENPFFPVRVSLGNRWRQWTAFREYRNGKKIHVKSKQEQEDQDGNEEAEVVDETEKEVASK